MTIHIRTITPNHVITVSDRLINTPSGHIELGDNRYKHLVLICDDARIVTSFAGFAGIVFPSTNRESPLKHDTITWITKVFQETSQNAHGIDDHLNDLWDQVQLHIEKLRAKYNLPSDSFKLAIQMCGWVGNAQFDCVIDNYLDIHCSSSSIRPNFKTRHKVYENEVTNDCSNIMIIGKEYLDNKDKDLFLELVEASNQEEPSEIFQASVKIIRAASVNSNGCVGMNCSGIRISRNDRNIEALGDREKPFEGQIISNTILSTSRISGSSCNLQFRDLE